MPDSGSSASFACICCLFALRLSCCAACRTVPPGRGMAWHDTRPRPRVPHVAGGCRRGSAWSGVACGRPNWCMGFRSHLRTGTPRRLLRSSRRGGRRFVELLLLSDMLAEVSFDRFRHPFGNPPPPPLYAARQGEGESFRKPPYRAGPRIEAGCPGSAIVPTNTTLPPTMWNVCKLRSR